MGDKLSAAIRENVIKSPFLAMGLNLGVLNFSALARVLLPRISASLNTRIGEAALHKALTRYAQTLKSKEVSVKDSFRLESLSIQGDVMILTYPRSREKHRLIAKWYEKALGEGKFFNITESSSEISVFTDLSIGQHMAEKLRPMIVYKQLTALRAAFHKKYLSRPGFIVAILQQLSMQGVNVVEVSSTSTELSIFLEAKDTMAAFDVLYYSMVEKKLR